MYNIPADVEKHTEHLLPGNVFRACARLGLSCASGRSQAVRVLPPSRSDLVCIWTLLPTSVTPRLLKTMTTRLSS